MCIRDSIRPALLRKAPGLKSTDFPYKPGGEELDHNTLSMSATHYNKWTELELHSMNGYLETYNTFLALKNDLEMTQPFVLTRATYVGSGQFSAHWTGDNGANWDFLRLSIPHLFSLGLYGIPFVGADVCGFQGDTTVELCSRWMQMSAIYPFSRNHNTIDGAPQEPYALGEDVLETSRIALKLRYALLKYFYALFIQTRGVGTVFQPLFFVYPNDPQAYADEIIDRQVMLGDDMMAVPVVEAKTTIVKAYFPDGKWYKYPSGEVIQGGKDRAATRVVQAPIRDVLPLFVREGSIVYSQDSENIVRSSDLNDEFYLKIALTEEDDEGVSKASGKMIMMTNLNDQPNVMQCFNDNSVDCFARVDAFTKTDENGKFVLTISFSKDKNANDAHLMKTTVQIRRIMVFGVTHKFEDVSGKGVTSDSQTEFAYTLRAFPETRYADTVVEISPVEFTIDVGQTVHFVF
eukprot:TRINITY_DN6974_c0_g2_i3.p1 TRINITY_DN6974_c0_g2~~TRINITY_DN6974_c0_g2_i3.p1  ORF type:complete len:473 (+),score=130.81 TRINITY_DN6974_c0_g2_i3:36-1421(+)